MNRKKAKVPLPDKEHQVIHVYFNLLASGELEPLPVLTDEVDAYIRRLRESDITRPPRKAGYRLFYALLLTVSGLLPLLDYIGKSDKFIPMGAERKTLANPVEKFDEARQKKLAKALKRDLSGDNMRSLERKKAKTAKGKRRDKLEQISRDREAYIKKFMAPLRHCWVTMEQLEDELGLWVEYLLRFWPRHNEIATSASNHLREWMNSKSDDMSQWRYRLPFDADPTNGSEEEQTLYKVLCVLSFHGRSFVDTVGWGVYLSDEWKRLNSVNNYYSVAIRDPNVMQMLAAKAIIIPLYCKRFWCSLVKALSYDREPVYRVSPQDYIEIRSLLRRIGFGQNLSYRLWIGHTMSTMFYVDDSRIPSPLDIADAADAVAFTTLDYDDDREFIDQCVEKAMNEAMDEFRNDRFFFNAIKLTGDVMVKIITDYRIKKDENNPDHMENTNSMYDSAILTKYLPDKVQQSYDNRLVQGIQVWLIKEDEKKKKDDGGDGEKLLENVDTGERLMAKSTIRVRCFRKISFLSLVPLMRSIGAKTSLQPNQRRYLIEKLMSLFDDGGGGLDNTVGKFNEVLRELHFAVERLPSIHQEERCGITLPRGMVLSQLKKEYNPMLILANGYVNLSDSTTYDEHFLESFNTLDIFIYSDTYQNVSLRHFDHQQIGDTTEKLHILLERRHIFPNGEIAAVYGIEVHIVAYPHKGDITGVAKNTGFIGQFLFAEDPYPDNSVTRIACTPLFYEQADNKIYVSVTIDTVLYIVVQPSAEIAELVELITNYRERARLVSPEARNTFFRVVEKSPSQSQQNNNDDGGGDENQDVFMHDEIEQHVQHEQEREAATIASGNPPSPQHQQQQHEEEEGAEITNERVEIRVQFDRWRGMAYTKDPVSAMTPFVFIDTSLADGNFSSGKLYTATMVGYERGHLFGGKVMLRVDDLTPQVVQTIRVDTLIMRIENYIAFGPVFVTRVYDALFSPVADIAPVIVADDDDDDDALPVIETYRYIKRLWIMVNDDSYTFGGEADVLIRRVYDEIYTYNRETHALVDVIQVAVVDTGVNDNVVRLETDQYYVSFSTLNEGLEDGRREWGLFARRDSPSVRIPISGRGVQDDLVRYSDRRDLFVDRTTREVLDASKENFIDELHSLAMYAQRLPPGNPAINMTLDAGDKSLVPLNNGGGISRNDELFYYPGEPYANRFGLRDKTVGKRHAGPLELDSTALAVWIPVFITPSNEEESTPILWPIRRIYLHVHFSSKDLIAFLTTKLRAVDGVVWLSLSMYSFDNVVLFASGDGPLDVDLFAGVESVKCTQVARIHVTLIV